jgi:hypothetical protein
MGYGAFVLLKGGCGRRESVKQVEIRLTPMLKILWIGPVQSRTGRGSVARLPRRLVFRRIWLIGRKSPFCYPDQTLDPKISPEFGQGLPESAEESIRIKSYMGKYIKYVRYSIF